MPTSSIPQNDTNTKVSPLRKAWMMLCESSWKIISTGSSLEASKPTQISPASLDSSSTYYSAEDNYDYEDLGEDWVVVPKPLLTKSDLEYLFWAEQLYDVPQLEEGEETSPHQNCSLEVAKDWRLLNEILSDLSRGRVFAEEAEKAEEQAYETHSAFDDLTANIQKWLDGIPGDANAQDANDWNDASDADDEASESEDSSSLDHISLSEGDVSSEGSMHELSLGMNKLSVV